ncbi:MAG: hypothetical protein MZU95_08855 [Desulfomicrobium escambiense]|nr:hypothetical protein [Desulfomicrobium escambiense]
MIENSGTAKIREAVVSGIFYPEEAETLRSGRPSRAGRVISGAERRRGYPFAPRGIRSIPARSPLPPGPPSRPEALGRSDPGALSPG